MLQNASLEDEEEEAPDDPTWVETTRNVIDEDDDEDSDDAQPPGKKRKSEKSKTSEKSNKQAGKSIKLSKCPHCFREFTNLKHHINQQHAQVTLQDGPASFYMSLSMIYVKKRTNFSSISAEKLQMCRVWLQLLFENRSRETPCKCT